MLTNQHQRSVAIFYYACFLISYLFIWSGDSLLHQTAPIFAVGSLDVTQYILLATGLAQAVISHAWLQLMLDVVFLLLPLLLTGAVITRSKHQQWLAVFNSFYNLLYSVLLCSLCSMSMQWFIGFIFLPLLFCVNTSQSFYYALHSLRYLFILFFFTAGLWKLRAGGLFNVEQMSAVLLKQHAALLVDASQTGYAKFILKLVAQPAYSYFLFLLGTVAELVFVIGFFSKRWDKWLLAMLLLFILLDVLLMQINYFPWAAFAPLFWFSRHKQPAAWQQF